MLVHYTLFQRNNGIVRNCDPLGTNLRTTLSNVAIPDAMLVSQVACAPFAVQRMHLQGSSVNQKTRPDEFVMQFMLAQYVAHVLT